MEIAFRCLTCPDKPLLPNDEPLIALFHLMGGHELTEESNTSVTSQCVALSNITSNNRIREDMGDIDGLCRSIKQYGLIQPIVLARAEGSNASLVAGGRRLTAVRKLGWTHLRHGVDFVWRDEDIASVQGRLLVSGMELEENIRRKQLHWAEELSSKAKLFEIMQQLHGESKGFGAGRSGTFSGFSIRKLADMLDENPSTTSRDLELAAFVTKHPMLAKLPTKADAVRKLGVAVTVAAMQKLATKSTVPVVLNTAPAGSSSSQATTVGADVSIGIGAVSSAASAPALIQEVSNAKWSLFEGPFQDNISQIGDSTIDLICTDLPYNIGLGDSSAAHGAGLGGFVDRDLDIVKLCADVAVESFRVLRPNRFGVFFYGMSYHQTLTDALATAGFTVDVYPFIWLRDRSAPPDGFARYSKTYDPALVASKGVPRFVRPNLPNSISIPSVRGAERLHAAQKPVGIMEKFILDMTTEGCVVLDMFAGAGTTGEAALINKRKVILFELEHNNCTLIRARLGVL